MQEIDYLRDDHHLAVALEIDRLASQDSYFQSRHLCANADLFLSFAYKAMCALTPPTFIALLPWRA